MPELVCRDLGMDCDHVVHGATVEEVKQGVRAHAAAHHASIIDSISTPEQVAQLDELMNSKIKA